MKTPTSPNLKVKNLSQNRERLARPAKRRPTKPHRHHLPAHVTKESQWESGGEPPQVKTSRIFIGMLALHLVAVGGLVAFHFFGHDPAPKMITQNPAAPTPAAKASPAAVPMIPPPAAPIAPSTVGYAEHIVRIDETWETIAAARGLTVDDVRSANPGIDCNVGRRLLLPPTPRVITAAPQAASHASATATRPALAEADPPSMKIRYALNPENAAAHPASAVAPAVPAAPHNAVSAKANPTAPESSPRSHVVAKGETVFSIAKQHHLTEKALLKANGLSTSAKIKPGQKLKLTGAN